MIKSLKVGVYNFKIKEKQLGYWGYVDIDNQVIYYDPKRGSNKDRLMTIFHEALHAISNKFGVNQIAEDDELIVRIYENAICQFIKDNKSFCKQLVDSIQSDKG